MGGNGDDWIAGGAGDDVFVGGPGQDSLIGGLGNDVVRYQALMSDFTFRGGPEQFQVIGAGGTQTLLGIEFLEFANEQIAVHSLPFTSSVPLPEI